MTDPFAAPPPTPSPGPYVGYPMSGGHWQSSRREPVLGRRRTLPGEERGYLEVLRVPWHRGWRPLVGMVLFTAITVALTIAIIVGPMILGAVDPDTFADETDDPIVFTLLNLSLAALIPAAMFSAWAVHRVRPGFVSSVVGRIRWMWLAIFTGASLAIVILVFVGSAFVLPADPADADTTITFVGWSTYLPILAAIVLTTPLQAAGEEYAFRGYIAQAIGAWAKTWRWVPVLVTGLLFALAHGSQNPALFTDRFMFGVALSAVTIMTGGLEAAIAMHAVNNMVGMLFASAIGDLDDSLTTTGTDWMLVAVDATQLALFLAVVVMVKRKGWMRRTTIPDQLPPPLEGYAAPPLPLPYAASGSWPTSPVPPPPAAQPWASVDPSTPTSADDVWNPRR